jgi:quinol monooxygenase YgiN
MFAITVTYLIKPGHEEAAAAHFRACLQPTRGEPGNRRYLIYRSMDEPRRFVLVEEYADEAAFEAHRATAYFEEHIRNGIMTLMESRDADRLLPLEAAA